MYSLFCSFPICKTGNIIPVQLWKSLGYIFPWLLLCFKYSLLLFATQWYRVASVRSICYHSIPIHHHDVWKPHNPYCIDPREVTVHVWEKSCKGQLFTKAKCLAQGYTGSLQSCTRMQGTLHWTIAIIFWDRQQILGELIQQKEQSQADGKGHKYCLSFY